MKPSGLWQREKDSNPHIQSQSLLCYPYTIPLFKPLQSVKQRMLLYQLFSTCQHFFLSLFFLHLVKVFLDIYTDRWYYPVRTFVRWLSKRIRSRILCSVWWKRMDSNHCRRRQQIYSLPPLATWVLFHMKLNGAGGRT